VVFRERLRPGRAEIGQDDETHQETQDEPFHTHFRKAAIAAFYHQRPVLTTPLATPLPHRGA
jgi:hypothetical protein